MMILPSAFSKKLRQQILSLTILDLILQHVRRKLRVTGLHKSNKLIVDGERGMFENFFTYPSCNLLNLSPHVSVSCQLSTASFLQAIFLIVHHGYRAFPA